MQKTPITKKGYQVLMDELENIKKVERPKVIAAIEEARGHGDLSENAEYQYAKEKQSFMETRIQELETKLATAEIIDTSKIPRDKVVFGSKFVVCNTETEEEMTYQIVGVDESDISNGLISIASPLAKALIGKKPGDTAVFKSPAGEKEYEVLKIIDE
ncbi:MAG TPA: transcription elongation factor GreA [Desulfomonilia bacterium]|jgi:transcription elongation factor GreA